MRTKIVVIMAMVAIAIVSVVAGVLAQAQATGPTASVEGTVISFDRRTMGLQSESANYLFYVGRRTVYASQRYPAPGETVMVQYINDRGYLKATQIAHVQKTGQALQQSVNNGKKARVGVADFEWGVGRIGGTTTITDDEGRTTVVKHKDCATGLEAMLVEALIKTKRFEAYETTEEGIVLIKQQINLTESGYAKNGKKRGDIILVDVFVKAEVTGWEPNTSGAGGRVRLPLGPFGSSGIGVGMKKSSMAITMSIFDASTSQILASKTVDGQVESFGISTGASTFPLSGNLTAFRNTPMQKVIQACIAQAVEFIADATPSKYYKY